MVPPEEVGFKYIQEVQQRESRSHNLTKLPADFFENLAVHIARLRELARQEMARDHMSTTATLAQNELKSTIRLAQDIVMLRLRKMANRAVDAMEGGKVDLRSLTPREKELYGEMARFMVASYDLLLPSTGQGGAAAPRPAASPSGPQEAPTDHGAPGPQERRDGDTELQARARGGGPEVTGGGAGAEPGPGDGQGGAEATGKETDVTSTDAGAASSLVHVLKDVPPFEGEGGRTYSLRRGDLVTLPKSLVDVLVSRGAVEEVQPVP